MPITVLYRISSNEVLKISTNGQSFADRDTGVFGSLTDPSLPDGTAVRETLAGGELGPMRVLGYAKINASGTVRNATQNEINTFAPAELDDENQLDADQAIDLFLTHPQFRKLMTAYSDIIKDELNNVRQWITDFKADVAAATNLADLKTRVAANPDLADRTLSQLKTAIQNRISKDD